MIKGTQSFHITPGAMFINDQSFALPSEEPVILDFQSSNTGKSVRTLTIHNATASVCTVSISVIEYGDINSGDDSYFLKKTKVTSNE